MHYIPIEYYLSMRKDYTQIAKNVLKYKNAVAPLLSFILLEILFIQDILLRTTKQYPTTEQAFINP